MELINIRKALLISLLLLTCIFNPIFAETTDWRNELGNKYNVIEILKSLLEADKIFVHSDMIVGDVDNNGRDELVIFATVVENENQDPPDVSLELILLSKKKEFFSKKCKYFIKARLRKISLGTNGPYIHLKDFIGDDKKEIILSSCKEPKYFNKNWLYIWGDREKAFYLVEFRGGEFEGSNSVLGKLDFKRTKQKENYIIINYGKGFAISETYKWDGEKYIFYSTTSRQPTTQEQKIIEYLRKHINEFIPKTGKGSGWLPYSLQLYPQNKLLAEVEDGHIGMYCLFQYKIEDKRVTIKKIDEFKEYKETYLREKYNFSPDKAQNFFRTGKGNYKWTPCNVFK